MNDPLRPLTLSEILDRTEQMYRERFLVYFGIGVVPSATLLVFAGLGFVLLAWAGSGAPDPATQGTQTMVAALFLLLFGLVVLPLWLGSTALGWAAMCQAASGALLGEPFTIREAYARAFGRGWRYVGLYVLLALIVAAGPLAALVGGAAVLGAVAALGRGAGAGGGLVTLAGFGVFALAAVLGAFALWMLVRLSLAYPACVVEELGPWTAIKRSNALSKGTYGRILVLLLLGAVLSWILALGAMVPVAAVVALIPAANAPQHAALVGRIFLFAWYGLSIGLQAVVRPVYGIALTLFYFDQRIRNEGFDIEWMMRQAGMSPEPTPAAETAPSPHPLPPAAPSELPRTGDAA